MDLEAQAFVQRLFLILQLRFDLPELGQALLLGGRDVGFGELRLTFAELLVEMKQLAGGAELLEVAEADQDLHDLRIEGRVQFHVQQQIREAWVVMIPPIVEYVRNATGDVLDRSLGIGHRVL